MSNSKEIQNNKSSRLSLKQNITLIASSVVILALVIYITIQPLYLLIVPFLIIVIVFCLIPLLRSKTIYSKPYIRAHGFLAAMVVIALGYFIVQLIKDKMGIQCTGLTSSRISCVEDMWLSLWGISLFVSASAAILCGYGIYTQLRLPK
jgi:hypothetical protein